MFASFFPSTVETAILAPSDKTVDNGTEVAFICTIPCAHSFSWYIGDEKISKRRFNSLTWTSFKAKAGIALELENLSTCSTNGNDYVDSQRLTIVATTELDGMPIQCAAGSLLESGPQSFSRYSILRVDAPPPITAGELSLRVLCLLSWKLVQSHGTKSAFFFAASFYMRQMFAKV